MKKRSAILALLLALAMLAACGKHEHEWEDATCETPETCATCGETRGEALGHRWKSGSCEEPEVCARCGQTKGEAPGHDWQSATCTEPETCARCGETRGEALGHDAQPADYWSASVCSRCGEELSPKLTPDFETYGLDAHIVGLNEPFSYKTSCYENENFSTVGKGVVKSYEITEGDGDALEKREGYDWRIVTFEVVFSDDNGYEYGVYPGISHEDYYDVRHHDDTLDYSNDEYTVFEVVYKGQAYSCRFFLESGYSDWVDHSITFTCVFYAQLPVGYDGMIAGLVNRAVPWPDGAYAFDVDNSGTIYFRMS